MISTFLFPDALPAALRTRPPFPHTAYVRNLQTPPRDIPRPCSCRRLARFTGLVAAALVATFIVIEAPLSGMSMNPARSLASAVFAHSPALWIYFIAPPLGMLTAAEVYVLLAGRTRVRCAKLHHPPAATCIFACGFLETT